MKKQVIFTDNAPKAIGPYSQGIKAGPFLFCSGQVAIDPKTNEVLKGSVEDQTKLVMKNIEGLLKSQNLSFENVVKTTIFLTDMNDFAKVNAIYEKSFLQDPPARSTVAVSGLPKGVNVEIEVIALLPN